MRIAWIACLASAALCGWSAVESSRLPRVPHPVVRGLEFEVPAPERDREPPVRELPDGSFAVDLSGLAFDDYDPPEVRADKTPLEPAVFPEPLPTLHGKQVELEGYPLVTAVEDGGAEHLLLTRFPPGCCFGAVPILDEWVDVELSQAASAEQANAPLVRVKGTLVVGENLDETGGVISLYRVEDATLEVLE